MIVGNRKEQMDNLSIKLKRIKLFNLAVVILCAGGILASCTTNKLFSPNTSSTRSTQPLPKIYKNGMDKSGTLWMCNPEILKNPCLLSLTTAVKNANNITTSVRDYKPATNPSIDCFYVYPTVSSQLTGNAALKVGPSETAAAYAQAAMFSRVCRVYAPIYRQVTVRGLLGMGQPKANLQLAYNSLLSAFNDYVTNFNQGRGFVLIGHSQGAFILTKLIQQEIDNNPKLRKRLVSAILLGGNLTVPIGKTVGGSFKHIAVCRSNIQTRCLIAYSSFPSTPPANSLFGRTGINGSEVVCVNPSALGGGSAFLEPLSPTHLTLGLLQETGNIPNSKEAWVTYPNYLRGQCEYKDGASYLKITQSRVTNDKRLSLSEKLGPTWGYHVYDMNEDLNALVHVVATETSAYLKG